MSAKAFFSKGWPTRVGFVMGKYLLPTSGRHVAAIAARLIVTLKPDIYHAVRSNLRHVLGTGVSEKALNRSVYRLFQNVARSYYELFHNVGRGEVHVKKFRPPVKLTPETKTRFEQALATGRGLFVLGCHMSNFDLAGIGMTQYLTVPAQALSLADPPPGFEVFNRLREKGNGFLTPITPQSLRDAMQRLREGGVVLTGVDRPVPGSNEPVTFFGETAYLPTGYIRIPLAVDCLVMTVSFVYEDNAYWVISNPPMDMVRTGDRKRDVEVNVRRVLDQVEAFIRRAPEQWMMFLPVWEAQNAG